MPLIVPPEGYRLRAGTDAGLAEAGARSQVVAEVAPPESMCEAVRAGSGYALLPASYVAGRVERGELATAARVPPAAGPAVAARRSSADASISGVCETSIGVASLTGASRAASRRGRPGHGLGPGRRSCRRR